MDLKQLTQRMPFQWKIQTEPKDWKVDRRYVDNYTGKSKATCVAYIDARDAMQVLDTVVGPDKWSSEFYQVRDTIFCKVGILTDNGWVYKSDAGSKPDENSGDDAVIKGEASDAFKRACVQWGIGRFLYDMEIQWITFDEFKNNRFKISELCNSKIKGKQKPTEQLPGIDYVGQIMRARSMTELSEIAKSIPKEARTEEVKQAYETIKNSFN